MPAMTDCLQPNNWEKVVAEFQTEAGDNIPRRDDLARFAIKPNWLNGRGASFHLEGHLGQVLVGVNVLREKLAAEGKLPLILQTRVWKDALNAGAIGHDLDLTDDAKDVTSPAYLEHGLKVTVNLPKRLTGIISPIALDIAGLLCYWHVPDDKELPENMLPEFKTALWILKDIDGAERIRFPVDHPATLDLKYLRFLETVELLPVIKELWRKTQDVDEIDPSVGFNAVLDAAVEMGLIRQ